MSGHSKWATIKHKKGAADKARGKLFNKLARQLEVAARAGGGDPDANPTLRTAVLKAKGAQMTNDAIDRAIKRGTGDGRRRDVRVDHVRGVRARRRGPADRRADRQPQPHRLRDPRRVHEARRFAGRARGGELAVRPSRRGTGGRVRRRGRADDGRPRGRCRRRRRRRRHVAGHGRCVADVRRARPRSRPPGSASSRPTPRWSPRTSCRSPRSRTPGSCCGSSR